MGAANGFLYPVLGFATCVAVIYMYVSDQRLHFPQPERAFVKRKGTKFILHGKPFYVNGWNSYWLMDQAVEEFSRPRVREMLQAGAKMGLTVCRTWAFNDGAYNALQVSPGLFDERVFQALDRVIAEARQCGVRLLLSLVNNLNAFGGKTQYVKWAWDEGVALGSSNDSFFFDPSIRNYFKSYVKAILIRKNSITGIEYRNDPTIFAWELINEPRCTSDPSGDILQDWIEEMSAFVKSVDKKHLLTIGLEGFYGHTSPEKLNINPAEWAAGLGVDFIRNSKVSTIDFASVHVYPDNWFDEHEFDEKLKYISKWIVSHIEDGDKKIKKPILFTEFGLSNKSIRFESSHRYAVYKIVLDIIYESAKERKSGAGAFAWQFMVGGMEEYSDAFGIIPWEKPEIYHLMIQQSCRLAAIHERQELKLGSLGSTC